ncbi:MAG: TRAP transporter small permease subunit [Paracoccaceae bacterium]
MAPLLGMLRPLQFFNDHVLRIGRGIAIVALALMVVVILLQVFFRYALNNALPWPDEAARFLMLWMTGLIAGSAYRRGGFVAIDMLEQALPRKIGAALSLVLLVLSLAVLIVGVRLGWNHVNSGWLFASSSLRLPLGLIGMTTVKLKLAYMYMSLFVGLILLTAVNIELILRSLITIGGRGEDLAPLAVLEIPGAE